MQTWTKAIGVIGALLGTGTASAATALKVEVVTYGGTNAWSLFVQKDEMTDTEHYWTTSPPRFLEDINGRSAAAEWSVNCPSHSKSPLTSVRVFGNAHGDLEVEGKVPDMKAWSRVRFDAKPPLLVEWFVVRGQRTTSLQASGSNARELIREMLQSSKVKVELGFADGGFDRIIEFPLAGLSEQLPRVCERW